MPKQWIMRKWLVRSPCLSSSSSSWVLRYHTRSMWSKCTPLAFALALTWWLWCLLLSSSWLLLLLLLSVEEEGAEEGAVEGAEVV